MTSPPKDMVVHAPTAPVAPRAAALTTNGSLAGLLAAAVEQKLPAAEMREVFELFKDVRALEAREAFFEALAGFQSECPNPEKTKKAEVTSARTAAKFNYMFAPLDETIETVRPYLQKYGFSYTWNSDVTKPGALKVTFVLRHIRGHSEESSMTIPTESAAAMSAQQKEGSAYTFAQRRTMWAGLGLVATDMEDPELPTATAKITEDQVVEILDLMTEAKADKEKFFRFLGVESLDDLPVAKYSQAIGSLRQRIENRGKKAAQQGGGQ